MKRFWSIPLMLMLFACQTPQREKRIRKPTNRLPVAGNYDWIQQMSPSKFNYRVPRTPTKKDTLTMIRRRQLICLGPSAIKVRLGIEKITIQENWEGNQDSIWLILERKITKINVATQIMGTIAYMSVHPTIFPPLKEYDLSTYLRAGVSIGT